MDLSEFKQSFHAYLTRNKALILNYHGVVSTPLDFELWTHIHLAMFEQQMEYLSCNCNVISLSELSQGIVHKTLKKNSVVLTFDDGFLSNYTFAYPVLKRLRLPATIFLSTGYLNSGSLFWSEHLTYMILRSKKQEMEYGQIRYQLGTSAEKRSSCTSIRNSLKLLHPKEIGGALIELESILGVVPDRNDPLYEKLGPMRWEHVQSMDSDPLISFGGHTSNHTILSRLNEEEALREVADCRTDLDKHLSKSTNLWAYPNGTLSDFNSEHRDLLIRNGFEVIVTTVPEYIDSRSDIAQLGRWDIGSRYTMNQYKMIMNKCNWFKGKYFEKDENPIFKIFGKI
jgi:peptidoglycan/xylan/chitin deacetylase (PgdA/CDA1 family)